MEGFFRNTFFTVLLTYLVTTSQCMMTVNGFEQRQESSSTTAGSGTTGDTTLPTTEKPTSMPSMMTTSSTGTNNNNNRPHFSGTVAFPPPLIEAVYKPAGNHNGTKISINFVPLGKVIGDKFPGSALYNFFNRKPNPHPGFFSHFRPNQTQGNHHG